MNRNSTGPFWWDGDIPLEALVATGPVHDVRTDVRWQAGARYTRTWRSDGTHADDVVWGKAVKSAQLGWTW